MSAFDLSRELQRGQARLEKLRERTERRGADPALRESVEELGQALEELRTSIEELASKGEELARARSEAELSARHYAELFHLAPDLYLVTDPDGVIREANRAAEEKLGHASDDLRGKPFSLFLAPPARAEFDRYLRAPGEASELRFEPRSAPAFWGSVRVMEVRDGGGAVDALRWIVRDVSERRRMTEALQEEVERSEAILHAAADALVVIDGSGTIEAFNQAAEQMFGFTAVEAIGRNVAILMPSPHAEEHDAHVARLLRTGESQVLGRTREFSARRRDGSTFPIELRVSRVGRTDRFAATIRDLSETRHVQQQLRAATAAAAVAEERERRNLGRDLHDDLGQLLALAGLKLADLRSAEGEAPDAGRLGEVEELVREAQQRTGSLTFRLSPPLLHEVGLAAAADWLAEEMDRRYGLRVTVEDDGRPKARDEATRTILFRGLRELLINVSRHAGTDEAHVRLWSDGEHVSLSVDDAGVGFDPAEAPGGFGLLSIRERLHHLGGGMVVQSVPGDGTRIVLTAPEREPDPADSREVA